MGDLRPITIHRQAHSRATAAPEPRAGSHPKCFTMTGVREVDTMPPTIPAVFIRPDTAPAFSFDRWTAVAQKAGSAKYSAPTLTHNAAITAMRPLNFAAANRRPPDKP